MKLLLKVIKFKKKLLNKCRVLKFSVFLKPFFKSCGKVLYIGKECTFLNMQYISIGNNFGTLSRCRIEAIESFANQFFSPIILIGDNVSFNTDIHIGCINKVTIGNNVLLASRIYISDHSHGEIDSEALKIMPSNRKLVSKGQVIIEDNVWIGEGVCILPNVTIGKNSIIGANAVVTKSFPKNSIIAGVPAKLIKTIY